MIAAPLCPVCGQEMWPTVIAGANGRVTPVFFSCPVHDSVLVSPSFGEGRSIPASLPATSPSNSQSQAPSMPSPMVIHTMEHRDNASIASG